MVGESPKIVAASIKDTTSYLRIFFCRLYTDLSRSFLAVPENILTGTPEQQ